MAHERAEKDHDLRRQRQRLPGLRERLLELRDDEDQQDDHRHDGDANQNRRVDQRRADILAELLVALHRLCQALKHESERAARFAGADDVHVKARENFPPRIERLRQRLAAANVVANALHQRRNRQRRGEADQDLERPVERQSGAQQRRELARQCEHLIARHLLRLEQSAARSACGARGCGAGESIGRLRNLHRHQALLAQPLDDVGFAGGVELAGRDFAARRDGAITENGHCLTKEKLDALKTAISSRA